MARVQIFDPDGEMVVVESADARELVAGGSYSYQAPDPAESPKPKGDPDWEYAKTLNKSDLEQYARKFNVELDRRKTFGKMLNSFMDIFSKKDD